MLGDPWMLEVYLLPVGWDSACPFLLWPLQLGHGGDHLAHGMLEGCCTSRGARGRWAVSVGSHRARCLPRQVYESGSNVDQFVTRFLLKETANQTQSLLSSVESAVDAIDEQTNPTRSAAPPALLLASRLVLVPGGWRERQRTPSHGEGKFSRWRAGVEGSRAIGHLSLCLPSCLPESPRGFPLLLCPPCPCLSHSLKGPA